MRNSAWSMLLGSLRARFARNTSSVIAMTKPLSYQSMILRFIVVCMASCRPPHALACG
jgi:hypothetical protein